MAKKQAKPAPAAPKTKRIWVSQSDIPKCGFKDCLKLAKKLHEELNGDASPHQLAIAMDISPTSSGWRDLTGASIAYGLTEGGCNASRITLSPLGKKIVAPTEEDGELPAMVEAALKPRIIDEFFKKYNKGKFPSEKIALNVLETFGVPRGRGPGVLGMITEIGEATGIIHQTKTGPYVVVDAPKLSQKRSDDEPENGAIEDDDEDDDSDMESFAKSIAGGRNSAIKPAEIEKNNKVFITHGKNREIVSQLKELLKFGKFDPVVSVEKETLSIPVPEKVMQDMRSCAAAVIHVVGEGEVMDPKGNKHIHINPNVLIEIGAAMALYEKNFVLLVHKEVQLPSNLQGLYRCEYDGDTLDYESTMKLLKTFNEFK